jgi:LPXTG-motif cell wall-anchored protein
MGTTGLLLAGPAAAHLTAEPAFLAVGSTQRIALTVHNDRDATMTGFRLTVPEGFRIRAAGGDESWTNIVEGATSSWTGGSLAAFRPTTLEVDLEAAGVAPGPVVLRGDQLYADEGTVSWPVTLTVVPAGSGTGGDDAVGGTAIVILVGLGLLVVGTFALVFWRRRRDARLQER